MPAAKKRKTAAKAKGTKKDHVVTAEASSQDTQSEPVADAPPVPEPAEEEPAMPSEAKPTATEAPQPVAAAPENEPAAAAPSQDPTTEPSSSPAPTPAPAPAPAPAAAAAAAPTTTMTDRAARLRALQSRAKAAAAANLSAAQTEAHRRAHDPAQLAAVHRRAAAAGQQLARAAAAAAGADFERQRAWDWTADEAARWDAHAAAQAARRAAGAFHDHAAEAATVYERRVRGLAAGDAALARYEQGKLAAFERAVARGSLEIVETESGEPVAVDRDGTFFGTGRDLIASFAESKPDKKAVDRLVGEMKKAEEVVAKKRRERLARNGNDGDATYINDKNKQFNQKLARFYNKYTADIRDSFERGTMI